MKNLNPILIRSFDLILALILALTLLPVMLFAMVLSALFIGFPPVYLSGRRGKNGVLFKHVKIKSLLPGEEIGRIFFERNRLNWCEKFLRHFHLDELTELFHIISGKMSFVGPRPILPKQLEGLDSRIRETVPPGWTGTAQLLLLKKGKLNKHLQIRLDNLYAKKRSLIYNLQIMAATVRYFFIRKKLDLNPDSTPDRIKFHKENLGGRP